MALEGKVGGPAKGVEAPRKWVQCAGSEQRYRGYPCGLWSVFHTMLSVATSSNTNSDRSAKKTLLTIRDYVKYFFGCRICAGHFLKMASNINLTNDQKWGTLALWLWRAHNQANARLGSNSADQSTDPLYPKEQFPTATQCIKCRAIKTDSQQWNEPNVLTFLLNYYMFEPPPAAPQSLPVGRVHPRAPVGLPPFGVMRFHY
jgi:thiol oxidase